MTDCVLCGLPTPDPPIRDGGAAYCCEGCRRVDDALDEVPDGDHAEGTAPDESDGWDPPEAAAVSYLDVDGMRCTSCEAFVAHRLGRHDGVHAVRASYPDGLVRVAHDDAVAPSALADAVAGHGYRARPAGEADDEGGDGGLFRLVVGGHLAMLAMVWYVVFLYPAYLDAGPAPAWTAIDGGPAGLASYLNLWLLTTGVLAVVGWPLLRSAIVSLRSGRPNSDLLVALAAVNAYLFSTAVMLVGGSEVYFDIAIVIVMAVAIGDRYERRMRRRAAAGLAEVTAAAADEARVERDGGATATVSVEDVAAGDRVVVRAGERVPVDGAVVEGSAAVDESVVTGRAVPARREPGDEVVAGGVVRDGRLVVETGDGDRTVDRLLDALWRARSDRGGAQRVADRVAGAFVPLVLAVAVAAAVWRLAGGTAPVPAVLSGLAVLVVSCPCALGIATPLAVASGVRSGVDRGVVVRNPEAFERVADVDVVALDKTGTLTTGAMRVVDDAPGEAMRRAAAVERASRHPIAEAIVDAAPDAPSARDVEVRPGRGVVGRVEGDEVAVGAPALFEELDWTVPGGVAERTAADDRVTTLIGWDGEVRHVVALADRERAGWRDAVARLAEGERRVVVITGDDDAPRFREDDAVDAVFAGMPPEAKAATVRRLGGDGGVAMVGDGSNDAPALAAADVGIAVGDASALATDAADVAVLDRGLDGVADAVALAETTRRRVRQNLGWAFGYNAVAIPVAALGLLNPLVAAVAMAASSLLVVGNSARRYLP